MASILIHVGLVSTAVHVGLPAADLPLDVIAAELAAPEPVAPPPPRKVEPPAPRVAPPKPKPEPPRVDTLPKLIEAPPPKVEEPPRIAETPPAPPPPVVASRAESAPAASAAAPTVSLPQASAPNASQSPQSSGVSIVTSEPRQAPVAPSPPGPTASITPDTITRTAIPRGGYQVRPSYPSSARRLGVEGTTMLKVHVDADGRVGDVVVEASAGHTDLDQAAVDAVRRWRFEPARRGAEAVAMWVRLPVEFRLR